MTPDSGILALHATFYALVGQHLGTVDQVLKLESAHPAIYDKLANAFWTSSRALLIGTDGDYSNSPKAASYSRQNSLTSVLKPAIRVDGSGGDASPRPKRRVRFEEPAETLERRAVPRLQLLTADGARLALLGGPSTSAAEFSAFCGLVDDDLLPPASAAAEPEPAAAAAVATAPPATALDCEAFLRRVRKTLTELHIGPVKHRQCARALQRFLSTAARSEVALRKIVLTYAAPDFLTDAPVSAAAAAAAAVTNGGERRRRASPAAGDAFPSRTTHSKLVRLVQRNSASLNAFKLFVDEDFKQWISLECTAEPTSTAAAATVDDGAAVSVGGVSRLSVEYNCECNMAYKQALYPFLSAFNFENRAKPTRVAFKIWARADALLSTVDYCLTATLPYSCRDAVTHLAIEVITVDESVVGETDDDSDEDVVLAQAQADKQAKKLAMRKLLVTEDLVPSGMRNLETIEWRFAGVELSHDEFHEICAVARPFRAALTTIQLGKQREIVANAFATAGAPRESAPHKLQ